jgi:hypothetical protein
VRLLGTVVFNQGAEGGLGSVLVQGPINRDLPAATTLCICSYPQLKILICHGLDLE